MDTDGQLLPVTKSRHPLGMRDRCGYLSIFNFILCVLNDSKYCSSWSLVSGPLAFVIAEFTLAQS